MNFYSTSEKATLPIIGIILVFFSLKINTLYAQPCSFVSPTVQFVSISSNPQTGLCEYTVNLEFDVQVNRGNKYIFVHLWDQSRYHFGSAGSAIPFNYTTQPTDDAASLSGILYSSLVNIGINSFSAPASFYSSYPPDASVPMANPSMMPGIAVKETVINSTTSRYLIEHVKILLPGPCAGTLPVFTGDAWSTNGFSANQVQCAMPGFSFSPVGPTVNGMIGCSSVANSLSFTTTKSASSSAVDYMVDVYVDRNGDGLFTIGDDAPAIDTDADINYHLTGANSPLTVQNPTLYYPANVSGDPVLKNLSLFVVLKNIVITNSDGSKTSFSDAFVRKIGNTCQTLPAQFGHISADTKNGQLQVSWQTLSEVNCKDFEIQVSKDGAEWTTIGRVASTASLGNSDTPLSYSFTGSTAVLGGLFMTILLFLPFPAKLNRILLVFLGSIVIYSCAKESSDLSDKNQTMFLRIVQHDIDDGTPTYSKVIKVVAD